MINVLLVDDHALVRTGVKSLLSTVEDIAVIGAASSGEQALLLTEQFLPDVILMDVKMPGMGGVEACSKILQMHPSAKIIALSGYNDGFIPQQLLKLGAMGFISKNSSQEEMVAAIRKVMAGEAYLCQEVINQSLSEESKEKLQNNPFTQLSKREMEVVNLILQFYSIQEMAEILKLSDKTVNTYRYRIYDKLQVKNDVELTKLARKWNYGADFGDDANVT